MIKVSRDVSKEFWEEEKILFYIFLNTCGWFFNPKLDYACIGFFVHGMTQACLLYSFFFRMR